MTRVLGNLTREKDVRDFVVKHRSTSFVANTIYASTIVSVMYFLFVLRSFCPMSPFRVLAYGFMVFIWTRYNHDRVCASLANNNLLVVCRCLFLTPAAGCHDGLSSRRSGSQTAVNSGWQISTTMSIQPDPQRMRTSTDVAGEAGSVQICPCLPLYPLAFQCLDTTGLKLLD